MQCVILGGKIPSWLSIDFLPSFLVSIKTTEPECSLCINVMACMLPVLGHCMRLCCDVAIWPLHVQEYHGIKVIYLSHTGLRNAMQVVVPSCFMNRIRSNKRSNKIKEYIQLFIYTYCIHPGNNAVVYF